MDVSTKTIVFGMVSLGEIVTEGFNLLRGLLFFFIINKLFER